MRISGTPWLNLRIAFSKPKANLTGILISYPATGGNGTILVARLARPGEPRLRCASASRSCRARSTTCAFDLQPKDMVIPAGRRLAFMILSSDNEHTLRPAPGTQLTVDTADSDVSLPIVGGADGAVAAGDRRRAWSATSAARCRRRWR